jgi:hypothetical protein
MVKPGNWTIKINNILLMEIVQLQKFVSNQNLNYLFDGLFELLGVCDSCFRLLGWWKVMSTGIFVKII